MKITVIMPVRNEGSNVNPTLESVLRGSRLPDEIVIADGFSTDDTVERIRKYQKEGGVTIRIVPNEDMSCGGGRNAASRAAEYDVLVAMDFGNLADPDWLKELAKPFEADQSLDLLGGVFIPQMRTRFERVCAAVIYTDDCLLPTMDRAKAESLVPENFVPGGMCFAFRRRAWERAGGFPAWARRGQDRLFGHRVRRIGGVLGYTLDARVLHEMPGSLSSLFDREYHYDLWAARIGLPHIQTRRLAASYSIGLILLGLSLIWPWLLGPLAVLGLAYLGRRAWWKLREVSKGSKTRFGPADWLLAVPILFVHDFSFLLGRMIGGLDAIVRPRWKRKTRAYLENGR